MEEIMPEGVGSYELVGGQFDGDRGREAVARLVVHRPSRTDTRKILVYHRAPETSTKDSRHSVYRFSHEIFAVLATRQDG
jgi:hypothetical protein